MKFEKWIHLREQEQGINPPEHEQGEENMDVPAIIARRLQMLLDEIEKKRNMPKAQQLEILTQVIQTLSQQFGLKKAQANLATKAAFQPQPAAQPQPQAMPPAGSAPQQGQVMA